MAFICKTCYDKLHPKETQHGIWPTMWDVFLKSFGPCETCWVNGDKSAKMTVGIKSKDSSSEAPVVLIVKNKGEAPPRKKWSDFEGASLTDDKALEKAVIKIGSIALAGSTGGYIFNASTVRKVLIDLCKEKELNDAQSKSTKAS